MEITTVQDGGVSRIVTKAGKCSICGQPIIAYDERELKDILSGVLRTCMDCIGLDLELPKQKKKGQIDYTAYLFTKDWARKREDAIKRACHACQLCKSVDNLEVHHNTYERLGSEWDSDLIVLCRSCHRVFHEKLPGKSGRVGRDKEERPLTKPYRRRKK